MDYQYGGVPMNGNFAEKILKLNEQWERTDKVIIADNIEYYLSKTYPNCETSFNAKWEKLMEITGCKKQTVYAWLNRSRDNVKVPLIKLCQIAAAMNIDVEKFLNSENVHNIQQ